MKLTQLFIVLACVFGIAAGQLLFKKAALALPTPLTALGIVGNVWLLIALAVYGLATVGWVFVLREVPLSLAYPLFALAFVIVPLLSWAFFGEQLRTAQWLGSAMIVAGIVVATR